MESKPPKNNLSDLEIAELENLLHSSITEEQAPYHSDVVSFLAAFNLIPGEEVISEWFLYDLYRKWTTNPVVSRKAFKRQLGNFLSPIPGSRSTIRYYKINVSGFKLSQRMYELSRAKKPQDRTKNPHYKRHFDAFVRYYELKPGDFWFSHDCMFYLYDLWAFKKPSRVSRQQFHKFAKLYFKEKRNTGIGWYAVDRSILRFISEEQITQIHEGTKKTYEKKTGWLKKGREKSQHKVSSSKKRSESSS